MATRYQVEEYRDGIWTPIGSTQETMTAAEILAVAIPSKTRVVLVDGNQTRPNPIPEPAAIAEIEMIKTLAADLGYKKVNYVATLESLIIRARRLFDDEARLIGRGYRDGENTACQSCNGVYAKEAK